MSEQTETIETVDDKELFQSAIEELAPEPATETASEPDSQPRDEKGRFATKQATEAEAAPTQQPPAEQPTEPKDDAHVPSWRLREVREAREAAERRAEEASRQAYAFQQQMAAMQRQISELTRPKQEPVDFFQDPDRALQQRIDPLQAQFGTVVQDLQRQLSETRAIARYGAAEFEAMENEVQSLIQSGDPEAHQLRAAVMNSTDPAGVAMRWYQDRKVRREVGNDPAAYKQRLKDELLKDPDFQKAVLEAARGQASVQTQGRPNIQLPPSLNRATGSGGSQSIGDDGDMSDRALFQHAISGSRR